MKLILSLCILLFVSFSFAEENILGKSSKYYKVSWENINCYVPPCPQYTVSQLNAAANVKPTAILKFNFPAELKSYEKYLTFNESNSVIVYGDIIADCDFPTKAFDFNVKRAYKRLPLGNKPKSTDKFYIFGDSGIRCIKAPCPSILANLVNSNGVNTKVNSINQPYVTNVGPLFDSAWLSSKTIRSDDYGLIGQATINSNGDVIVSNSYVALPDPQSKCPELPLLKCKADYITIFTRNENRCLENPSCVESGACILSIPVCKEGYELDSWRGSKFGCNSYSCDAYFLTKTHN